jgi:hypothetical protein
VALMVEAHRNSPTYNGTKLSPNAVKAILQFSATSLTDPATAQPYDTLTQGMGEINARGAMDLAKSINASARLGSYWMTSLPSPVLIGGGGFAMWSQRLVWGSHLVWGSAIYFHELGWDVASPWGVLDATHIVWGSVDPAHLVWGNTAVWGSHIVWGNSLVGTVDGEHIVWGNLVDAEHIVWGNLSEGQHIVWGNAETVLSNSDDGTGELIVQEPEPPFEP